MTNLFKPFALGVFTVVCSIGSFQAPASANLLSEFFEVLDHVDNVIDRIDRTVRNVDETVKNFETESESSTPDRQLSSDTSENTEMERITAGSSLENVIATLEKGGIPINDGWWQTDGSRGYLTPIRLRLYWMYLCNADQPQCPAGSQENIFALRLESPSKENSLPSLQAGFEDFTRAVLVGYSDSAITLLTERINQATREAFMTRLNTTWVEGEKTFPVDMSGLESLNVNVKVLITTNEPNSHPGVIALHFDLK